MFEEAHLGERTRRAATVALRWNYHRCEPADGTAAPPDAILGAAVNFYIDFLLKTGHMSFWSVIFQYMEDA